VIKTKKIIPKIKQDGKKTVLPTNTKKTVTAEQIKMLKDAYKSLVQYRDDVNNTMDEFEKNVDQMMKDELRKIENDAEHTDFQDAENLLNEIND